MTKILTFNVDLDSNLGYARTMRNLIQTTQKGNEWVYGQYGYIGSMINKGYCILSPSDPLHKIIEKVKPDIILMHDDPQRCKWLPSQKMAITIYWIPLDNEDIKERDLHIIMGNVDIPVSLSKFAQVYFKKKGMETEQIYNPVDTTTYYPDEKAGKDMRKQFNIQDDETVFLFVGRPNWRKRIITLLTIFKKIHDKDPKTRLIMITDMKDPCKGKGYRIEEVISAFDLMDGKSIMWPANYKFEQGVPSDVLRGIYNACDIYLAPHGGEGMGLPIVEAMACGKPFIATDYTTTQEFANYPKREGKMIGTRGIGVSIASYLLEQGIKRPLVKVDEFVEKAILLKDNKSLQRHMGLDGIKFIQDEVSLEVVAAKWNKLLSDIGNVNTIDIITEE